MNSNVLKKQLHLIKSSPEESEINILLNYMSQNYDNNTREYITKQLVSYLNDNKIVLDSMKFGLLLVMNKFLPKDANDFTTLFLNLELFNNPIVIDIMEFLEKDILKRNASYIYTEFLLDSILSNSFESAEYIMKKMANNNINYDEDSKSSREILDCFPVKMDFRLVVMIFEIYDLEELDIESFLHYELNPKEIIKEYNLNLYKILYTESSKFRNLSDKNQKKLLKELQIATNSIPSDGKFDPTYGWLSKKDLESICEELRYLIISGLIYQ